MTRGRDARTACPREAHAALAATDRDPVALLERQAASRLPELVPIRYGRMLASPFAFFRGAAAVMAHDLAAMPRTDLEAQLCGDAHLANFGGFASPEREVVFDLNDFDETLPGPFEWDVKRLAASVEVVGRDRDFSDRDRGAAVLAAVESYRTAMRSFAGMRNLDVWYALLTASELQQQLAALQDAKGAKALERATEKARTKDHLRAFAKLTRIVDGEARFASDPPLLVPIAELVEGVELHELQQTLRAILRGFEQSLQYDRRRLLAQYRYADMARKIVGVGSVGTRCWVVLLIGRDEGDPLLIQIKEAEESVLERHLSRSTFENQGERVVQGQRLMQGASDIFLGWHRAADLDGRERDFYGRQLWDWKTTADLAAILPHGLVLYARACGWTLARAHARSGDRIAIAAYLGKGDVFDRALVECAAAYGDQNERDHAALREAVREGRVVAAEAI